MAGQVVQIAGSLAAILLLFLLAGWLKLGRDARLTDERQVRELADETWSGFDAVAIGLDREGRGALAADREGRILLLRLHGAHGAGRLLERGTSAERDGETLRISTSDKRFGSVTLDLGGEAAAWEARIGAL
ncbi:hypothetical protein [Qipengyuania atrilutea]|uniref:Uncharacterized protein n=1 Tax=Qipengyuania atrilutea TaxID=2744473 RepID=A0A850GYH6_9SPHN|nr:hypothetical protein [Actirhodobacter atriluteus]NVD44651.1 hypothetical protein [Actirhodobacter atriluteus]